MSTRTSSWPAGIPCWADLSAPDIDAAKRFYADVVGWSFQDSGAGYGGYTIAEVEGAPAAGIGPQQPGAPAAWTLYMASDDAAAAVAAAERAGGSVLAPAFDTEYGRMAGLTDPSGAMFWLVETEGQTTSARRLSVTDLRANRSLSPMSGEEVPDSLRSLHGLRRFAHHAGSDSIATRPSV